MNKDKFLDLLKRGTSEIISEQELNTQLNRNNPLRVKVGVDPTSPDLHLGHTVILRKLKLFQDYGHKVIFIIGDLTARIGDPSGQDSTRPILSEDKVLENAKTYQEQLFKVLDKDKTEVVYNSEWLIPLGLQGILELAKHSTVAQMLHRADFNERYKNGVDITILEFLYPLVQGYDSVAVKADVELGGSDQKFNLLMGREIQQAYGHKPQIVMMMPLLVGTDGTKKMSKSYNNYIALNDSPKNMYGKTMSIPDNLMVSYYELLTDLDMERIKENLERDPRDAKAKLAKWITSKYYSEESAEKAQSEFDKVFSNKGLPDDIPVYRTVNKKQKLSDFLAESKLAPSKKEAKRLIAQNAVEIDEKKISEDNEIKLTDGLIIRVGKRKFCKIQLL